MVDDGASPRYHTTTSPPQAQAHQAWLLNALHLASLVLAQAPSVQAFRGKWITISNRSQRLSTSLSAIASSPCFRHSSLLPNLSPHILSTLHDACELARRCSAPDYGGKLLMQSNLDAVATRLDLHLRDLELLLKSGAFLETAALATSSSSSSSSSSFSSSSSCAEASAEAKREAAVLHLWDLFARLKIGNTEIKKSALQSLIDHLKEGDGHAALIGEEGDIPSLIHLLDSSVPMIREKAADAVSILARTDLCKHSLTSEGVHAPLIRLLETGSPVANEKSAEALQELTYVPENAHAVAAFGGVPALVEICRSGTPGAGAMAAGVLRNLASNEEIRRCLVEEGAIPVLINLVISGTALAQENATEALQNLASSDDRLRLLIARQGGIQPLLMFLSRATSPKTQEIAIRALRNLAASSTIARALVSEGYLSQLAAILKTGTSTVQHLAASAICNLSASMDVKKALGEAGCVLPLTKMLEAKNSFDQETATQVLSTLLVLHKEENSLPRLVQLLDPHNQGMAKRFSISALLALSGGNCKKRVLFAGARQQLEKLVEIEAAGAKKTLNKMGGSKLRNIFSLHRSQREGFQRSHD